MRFLSIAMTFGITGYCLLASSSNAQAADFTFSANFSNGDSVTGAFATKNSAPTSFSETAATTTPYTTQYLQSTSLSVFTPSQTLLDSGGSVTNSTSSDQFLLFSFNGSNKNITGLDVSTQFPANKNIYYFLSNNVDPSGNNVGVGDTTFNLFQFTQSTNTTTFLGSATSLQVSAVPEPSEVLGTLFFGTLAAGYLRHRQSKKAAV